jgi:nucleotidyltransferase substrate binding protein (TIGR01987 family)
VDRLKERLTVARRALGTLQELLLLAQPSRVERDAAIQRFEYTCEAIWKAAQRYLLEVEGLSVGSPKGSIRASRDVGLLNDEQATVGLEMIDDRNLTVHTYNETVAEDIYSNLAQYADLLTVWLAAMEGRLEPR